MKKPDAAYITVGKIGSTYGVRGWLKIHTYTEFGASILDYKPWYLSKNQDDFAPIEIEESRLQGNTVLVKFTGIETPEAARLLTSQLISVPRDQLPKLKENEYYWSDLIGLTVINKDGTTLGKVIYLIETGSNDVLVVKGDKEYAVPYLLGDVIKSVDLAKQEIHVDWELI